MIKLCLGAAKADADGVAMDNIGLEKMIEQRGKECGKQRMPRNNGRNEIGLMFRKVLFLISQLYHC
jgi:hypothetical protein